MTAATYILCGIGVFAIVWPLAVGLYLWHCERKVHRDAAKGSNLKGPLL